MGGEEEERFTRTWGCARSWVRGRVGNEWDWYGCGGECKSEGGRTRWWIEVQDPFGLVTQSEVGPQYTRIRIEPGSRSGKVGRR